MSGKSTTLYVKALEMIKAKSRYRGTCLKLTNSLCDFEKATINAFTRSFPNISHTGCIFHLDQIIIKRVKLLGLYSDFLRDHSFYIEISCLMSLAYMKPDEIMYYFNDLFPTLSQKAKQVASWFKVNYIQGENGRLPNYSTQFWRIYENFINGFPTTQNWAESYHHRIHSVLDAERLPIYKFILFLLVRVRVLRVRFAATQWVIDDRK